MPFAALFPGEELMYLLLVKSGGTLCVCGGALAALLTACSTELSGPASGGAQGDGDTASTGGWTGDGDASGDGDFIGDGDTSSPSTTSCEKVGISVGSNVLRRLSRVEY